ncbi:MAG: inner membrane-spanning protein YciB [Ostreibacterium sp.]
MHALLELLPIIGLAGGYLIGKSIAPDMAMFYLSYGAILGTLVQFITYRIRQQKIQKMTLITGWLLIIFASLTIILHNDLFVKLKPTVLSWAFAIAFLGYAYVKKETLLELMMGKQFEMPQAKWRTLNWAWVIFNFLVGLANLIVVIRITQGIMSNDTWVSFKIALLPISLIFIAGQTVYLFRNGQLKKEPLVTKSPSSENDKREM